MTCVAIHIEWATEDLIFGKSGRGIVFHNITSDETETVLGRFDDPRGDLALSTDSTMFVNGWEEENQLFYHIVRLTDGMQVKSVPLERGPCKLFPSLPRLQNLMSSCEYYACLLTYRNYANPTNHQMQMAN